MKNMEQLSLISLLEEPRVNPSQSLETDEDWMMNVVNCSTHIYEFLNERNQLGVCGKTCPAFCTPTKEEILVSSSGRWGNSGMGTPTEFLTLNTSESHKDEEECSLLDILETGDVPQRYYLSQKACAGLLRRAQKRGKTLPEPLRRALELVGTT